MKFRFLKSRKFWRRLVIWTLIIPVFFLSILISIVYFNQDKIVQELITELNQDFTGEVEIDGSHISPFEAFPYISIDLEHVMIYEDKLNHKDPIVNAEDIYVGFNIWDLIVGNFDIQLIEVKNGYIHAIQHKDGELNIAKALTTEKDIEDLEEEFHVHLKEIDLINMDIYKINEANGLMVESFVDIATLSFETNEASIHVQIESKMEMNIIDKGDTTFFRHKHLDTHVGIDYFKESQIIQINPSQLELEHVTFQSEGKIDILDDINIDISLFGDKKNFDLFIAFAPEELSETLDRYGNGGNIFFDAKIYGKIANGNIPNINAKFGCEDAYFDNKINHKKVDSLNFHGSFTNSGGKDLSNMEFELMDFYAQPEAGTFKATLHVVNFESPEIEMTLDSDFDLNFLAEFANQTDFENLEGQVELKMKFHDIIDLTNPEKSIEKLNEAYYSELKISGLSFNTGSYHLPLNNLDTKIKLDGHEATIQHLRAKVGTTDINISGSISDLPAILHHSSDEIVANLAIKSKLIDLGELANSEKTDTSAINEKINDLTMQLKFISSARSFTESANLPVGEFFMENLYAKLDNYPHVFHDFHADVLVEDSTLQIIDFSGMIDKSDFHFNGKLSEYEKWMQINPKGNTNIEFDLVSNHLELHDLFSYQGENYVPEDYRHESLSGLKFHGGARLYFDSIIQTVDVSLNKVTGKMKIHPMRLEYLEGSAHYEDDHLMINNLTGKLGKSIFDINLNYYLGKDESIRKRDNHFGLVSSRLDFDELFNYNGSKTDLANTPEAHEAVFNIYDIPFTNMTFDLKIDHLNYHRYLIKNFNSKLRINPDHYIYIDTMHMNIAGGKMNIKGYFNGSNRDKIYFSPNIKIDGIDLEKLLFKFENFGQDYILSENLQGEITSEISGKIHMHPDLIPVLDDSEVHMDVEILDGRLIDYKTLLILEPYFGGKNLHIVQFDTLKNNFNYLNGTIDMPLMTINSSLGYMQFSGTQDMDLNMEYYLKVPLKLIGKTAWNTLFGKKEAEVDKNQIDEIEYLDPTKKTAYVNIKVMGNIDDYTISIGKDKKEKKKKN